MDGFYVGYITGRAGNSMVLLVIRNARLVGADVSGMKYDGEVHPKPDTQGFTCRVSYTILPGATLITGPGPVATPTDITLNFELPANFAEGPIVRIDTPMGPLNARFMKLRDLD
jgi:hypothetical protein